MKRELFLLVSLTLTCLFVLQCRGEDEQNSQQASVSSFLQKAEGTWLMHIDGMAGSVRLLVMENAKSWQMVLEVAGISFGRYKFAEEDATIKATGFQWTLDNFSDPNRTKLLWDAVPRLKPPFEVSLTEKPPPDYPDILVEIELKEYSGLRLQIQHQPEGTRFMRTTQLKKPRQTERVRMPFSPILMKASLQVPAGTLGKFLEGYTLDICRFPVPVHPSGTVQSLNICDIEFQIVNKELSKGLLETVALGSLEIIVTGTGRFISNTVELKGTFQALSHIWTQLDPQKRVQMLNKILKRSKATLTLPGRPSDTRKGGKSVGLILLDKRVNSLENGIPSDFKYRLPLGKGYVMESVVYRTSEEADAAGVMRYQYTLPNGNTETFSTAFNAAGQIRYIKKLTIDGWLDLSSIYPAGEW